VVCSREHISIKTGRVSVFYLNMGYNIPSRVTLLLLSKGNDQSLSKDTIGRMDPLLGRRDPGVITQCKEPMVTIKRSGIKRQETVPSRAPLRIS
jgi:hypothetical protein